jgi:hypothetical protein
MTRQFTATKAVRKRVPLLIGLIGPSGGGKTLSGLRLAEGIRRVCGGAIRPVGLSRGAGILQEQRSHYGCG